MKTEVWEEKISGLPPVHTCINPVSILAYTYTPLKFLYRRRRSEAHLVPCLSLEREREYKGSRVKQSTLHCVCVPRLLSISWHLCVLQDITTFHGGLFQDIKAFHNAYQGFIQYLSWGSVAILIYIYMYIYTYVAVSGRNRTLFCCVF